MERASESHKRRRSAAPDEREQAKSKRKNAVYSARLRAKKKNEMQQLKEQVAQLQMQLHRLKSAKASSSSVLTSDGPVTLGGSGTGSSCWLQEATAQAYQRQQSEALNAQLKALLAKVVNRPGSMKHAFQNLQSLGGEINVAVGARSRILRGTSLRSNAATSQLGELREVIDQMYANAHDVFMISGAGSTDSASLMSQIKRDPVSGKKAGSANVIDTTHKQFGHCQPHDMARHETYRKQGLQILCSPLACERHLHHKELLPEHKWRTSAGHTPRSSACSNA